METAKGAVKAAKLEVEVAGRKVAALVDEVQRLTAEKEQYFEEMGGKVEEARRCVREACGEVTRVKADLADATGRANAAEARIKDLEESGKRAEQRAGHAGREAERLESLKRDAELELEEVNMRRAKRVVKEEMFVGSTVPNPPRFSLAIRSSRPPRRLRSKPSRAACPSSRPS